MALKEASDSLYLAYPLDQALALDVMLALMKVDSKILAFVKPYQEEAFGEEGVVNEDVEAGACEMEVVAAYLEVPLA